MQTFSTFSWFIDNYAVLRIRNVYPRSQDPDFFPSRIPDLVSRIQKPQQTKGVKKKLVVIPFLVATNFTKYKLFYFWNAEEKNLAQFSKNYRTFYPKICHQALKIWGWDPGSEIRKKTYSGSRIRVQGSKRHRIPDPDPQHWCHLMQRTIWINNLLS
jgi:hypothetical protein